MHQIELEMQNDELRRAQLALQLAHDRYLDLYDFAPVGYLTLSAEGLITAINLTGAALLGVERGRLVGSRFARHVAPGDRDRWHRFALGLLRRGDPECFELALLGPAGRSFHAQLDSVRKEAPGATPMLRITVTDIRERKRIEAELRLAATAFETQEGIMITDARGVIERVNKAFTQITGYSAQEAIGQTARLLQSGRHDAAFYAAMWDSLRRTNAWQGEIWNRRKNGELYPQWLTITAVADDAPEMMRFVGTMQDISQRKAREEEIALLAFYDPLTGLPNRRLMKDRLQQAMAVSSRTRHEGALMFIDLDHFKNINDTLGHDNGDLLLQQVAQRLTACVRAGDTVARLGGDEFVVMLETDLNDEPGQAAAQARAAGEKILAALSRPYEIAGQPCHCNVSIGIALFSDHVISMDDVLKRADLAMYQAKAAGRNTLRLFDLASQHLLEQRTTLATELRQALRQGEFELHYQPMVDHERRAMGVEALVRWRHPHRGLVLPGEFIPVIEEIGLIDALGRWVLEVACKQLAAWASVPHLARLTLSVNISALQLRDPRFVPQVLEVLDRSGAAASRLKLELTESVMLDDVDESIAKLNVLKARGVGFALDDFGTGYASLAYLKRLPLDQLKIDRGFVRNVVSDPHDAAIARTIVELGRSLGLTVIAEGVETEAQHAFLVGLGCHVFQGYLFGRPGTLDALWQVTRPPTDPAAVS